MLLGHKYEEQGTMYRLMRAGEADRLNTPIVKERVLVLKSWLELTSQKEI